MSIEEPRPCSYELTDDGANAQSAALIDVDRFSLVVLFRSGGFTTSRLPNTLRRIECLMNPFLLVTLYLSAVMAPLMLAFFGARPARSLWDELASGAGLLAFAIILAEFVLSGRFRIVSRRIGMDVTMRFHQLLSRTALVLAILHPFLYRSAFDPPRPWDPSRELTLTYDLESLGTGILGWVLLPAFVLLSISRCQVDFRYEMWRLMHGFGAVLIAGLVLHHALSAGRYSAGPLLANTWRGMFVLAIASLVWVYVVQPLHQLRRPWRVRQVRSLGPAVGLMDVK